MSETVKIDLKTLIEDSVSCQLLWALSEGRAYTARELALHLRIEQVILQKQLDEWVALGLLLKIYRRHDYYRLATTQLVHSVQKLEKFIPTTMQRRIKVENTSGMKYCRTCYRHLAGKIGVAVADALLAHQWIKLENEDFVLTVVGQLFFENLGINVEELRAKKGKLIKACLDFSERRYHLSGLLGEAFFNKMLELGWIRKTQNSRAIMITEIGKEELSKRLSITF